HQAQTSFSRKESFHPSPRAAARGLSNPLPNADVISTLGRPVFALGPPSSGRRMKRGCSPAHSHTEEATVSNSPSLPEVPVTKPKAEEEKRTRRIPPYHVILENDDFHSFEFVVDALRKALGYTQE